MSDTRGNPVEQAPVPASDPRAHGKRPRDPLGRPLPRGVPTQLQLEDFEALSPEENQALGLAHFNAGQFFAAHEAWETCWKASTDTDARGCFKGLAQVAAGYLHLQRGNPHGAYTLLHRGAATLAAACCSPAPQYERAIAQARAHADAIERATRQGTKPPTLRPHL